MEEECGEAGQQLLRADDGSLTVQLTFAFPFVMGSWRGSGRAENTDVARQAAASLLDARGEALVLELAELFDVSPPFAAALGQCAQAAQQRGWVVTLVRCPATLFRTLCATGLRTPVQHAISVWAATMGRTGEPSAGVDLHFQGTTDMLARVRTLIRAMLGRARVKASAAADIELAIHEAVSNAIRHGSPQGAANRVRLSLHIDHDVLIADVADQGGGFEPAPDPITASSDLDQIQGLGLVLMQRLMDRIEVFPSERGSVVRLTRQLEYRQEGAEA